MGRFGRVSLGLLQEDGTLSRPQDSRYLRVQHSNQKLTNFFQGKAKSKSKPEPPAYVFTTVGNDEGEVYWSDSVVAWSIFYHQIGKAVLYSRTDIQLILDKIQLVGAGKLKYFRWDSSALSRI